MGKFFFGCILGAVGVGTVGGSLDRIQDSKNHPHLSPDAAAIANVAAGIDAAAGVGMCILGLGYIVASLK